MNAAASSERFVTARVVAEHLEMSIDFVLDKYQEGRLPGYKLGRAVRFKMSEVEAAIEAGALDPKRGNDPPRRLRSAGGS